MFYEYLGERFRSVFESENGLWIVSYDHPREPRFVLHEEVRSMEKIEPPKRFLKQVEKNPTMGQNQREALIRPLINNPECIIDRKLRRRVASAVADENGTTIRRIQLLYYRYLAGRPLVEERTVTKKPESLQEKNFAWAIEEFYYSAKKVSLQTAYDLMLLARYVNADGKLLDEHPTWNQFRHFFYGNNYHKKARVSIARNGLSNYQRNQRPLSGSAMGWRKKIGAYQMDATQADIYLVSRVDKKAVVGRPNIYMAVDTATQLIAGIYVGFESGEQAVISCLCNAAEDKVAYCKRYGIDIKPEEWPSRNLPYEIITDKGNEFSGRRVMDLVSKFGIDLQTLPPFRPDEKGLVEKCFDLIQERYKPLLRGKGIIEEDAQERWAVDYRSQAVLDLDEFTKVVIHCVLYLNHCRVLQNCPVSVTEADPVPSQLWKWFVKQDLNGMIPIGVETLYQMSLPRVNVTLTRKGINYKGLTYVAGEYEKLLEQYPIGSSVQIAYDADNVNCVYLILEDKWKEFKLAKYCRQYAGISESEYKVQKERTKEKRKELQHMEAEGRLKFIKEVQEIVRDKECKDKGKLDRATIKSNQEREVV